MKKAFANIIRGVISVLSQLPLGMLYFIGDVVSWVLRRVVGYRTGVVWMNISRAFPDKKFWELKNIYKAFYRHLGEIAAEAIWFGGCTYKSLQKASLVTVKNPELLAKMYEESPSVTLMCSHCGNWEIFGGIHAYLTAGGVQMPFEDDVYTFVYKQLSNEVADMVFARNRSQVMSNKDHCLMESKKMLRYCIRNSDKKMIYGYPADQTPYRGMGRHDMGQFLNQKTYAMTGSLGVACKLSHSVVYLKMKHLGRGKYEWEFIPICADASKHTPDELMRKYYDLLEMEINETPHNWLWSHNRWKIR